MSAKTISVRSYWLIWAALMALLGLTWGVAEMNLGLANTVVAMFIALIKMALVILFFMHVRYNSKITWVFAGAGFVLFLIMVTLTMTDYATRGRVRPANRVISYWEYGPPQAPPGDYPGGVNPGGIQQPPTKEKPATGN